MAQLADKINPFSFDPSLMPSYDQINLYRLTQRGAQ